jgi:SEC-C motif
MSRKADRGSSTHDVARTYPELLTKLKSQAGFLRRSTRDFDAGHLDEGERLANQIRLLLHDTGSSHSLFGQLGIKGGLRYTDTAIHDSEQETKHLGGDLYSATIKKHAGLVSMQPTETGSWAYVPVLEPKGDRINPPAAFDSWWRSPFLKDATGYAIARSTVVLFVANKDGGSHVDKARPETFHRFLSGSGLGIQVASEDGEAADIPGIVMATTRQISYELLDTMRRDLPNFILGSPSAESAELTDAERSGIPRNAGCPCGSGKKFKICHGS